MIVAVSIYLFGALIAWAALWPNRASLGRLKMFFLVVVTPIAEGVLVALAMPRIFYDSIYNYGEECRKDKFGGPKAV